MSWLFLIAGEPGIGKRAGDRGGERGAGARRTGRVGPVLGRGRAPAYWPWREAFEGLGRAFPDAASNPAEARFALFREVRSLAETEALIVFEDSRPGVRARD